jgi:hypothetical protein
MSTFEEREARAQEIRASIQNGAINDASTSKLSDYTAWLSDPAIQGHFNGQNYLQVCETVRLNMLRAMLESFEQRGKSAQRWVVALAVAALVTSLVQAVAAIRAEVRASAEQVHSSKAGPAAQLREASTPPAPSASARPTLPPVAPASK